jgi:hypothetical protein
MIDLKKIKGSYGIDLKKEVEGQWFPLSMIDGVEVKVARAGNPNYKKALRRLMKPYAKSIHRGKDLAPEVEERIQTDLLVETILLDWKGMPGENGKTVPYSQDLAKMLLNDPELKELRDEINEFAGEFDSFKQEVEKELEKN